MPSDLLAEAMLDDSLLCLANAVCWLDPLWKDDEGEYDVPQDEDGTLATVLRVTRQPFPDVYAQAVGLLRQGANYDDLDHLICGAITDRGIPLDGLEWIGFGVPMPAYGAVLDDRNGKYPYLPKEGLLFPELLEPEPEAIPQPEAALSCAELVAHGDQHLLINGAPVIGR